MDPGVGAIPAPPALAGRVTEGVSPIRVGVAAAEVPPSVEQLELAAARGVPQHAQGGRGAGGEGGHRPVHPNIRSASLQSWLLPAISSPHFQVKLLIIVHLCSNYLI